MVQYVKKIPDTNNQKLHHFISNLPWGEKPVIKLPTAELRDIIIKQSKYRKKQFNESAIKIMAQFHWCSVKR